MASNTTIDPATIAANTAKLNYNPTPVGATAPSNDPNDPNATVNPGAQAAAATAPGGIVANQIAAGAAPAAGSNVGNWYRSTLGRDPDQGGLDYWNKRLAAPGSDTNAIYNEFSLDANQNKEKYTSGLNPTSASSYGGPMSAESNTNVDEWAKNNGITLTPAQKTQYESAYNTASAAGDVAGSQGVYAQMLKDHGITKGLDYTTAGQLAYGASTSGSVPVMGGSGGPSTGVLGAAYAGSPNTNSNITTGLYNAANYNPTQLSDPTKWNVSANQTAQGQMANMIDPNSPYYQAWAHAGAAEAAARGFTGNSSIRDSAILDSVMRNATPIATNDAAVYAKSASYNADMPNQFAVANQNALNRSGEFNAGQSNTRYNADQSNDTQRYGIDTNALTSRYNTDTGNATQRYGIDSSAKTQMATANLSADTQRYVAGLGSDTQKAIAGMNNASQQLISKAHDDNSALIQTNQNAATIYRDYFNAVLNTQNSNTMAPEAKGPAIDNLTNTFNATMANFKSAGPGIIAGTALPQSGPAKLTKGDGLTKDGVPDVSGQIDFSKNP